jgi:hypothetical protein
MKNNSNDNLPFCLHKYTAIREIQSVIYMLESNLMFDRLSLKLIDCNNKFLTPKLECVFNYMEFKSIIVKFMIDVKYF